MATRALKTVGQTLEENDAERASVDVAMANAFAEIEAVSKDKVNPHFKSKYADLGSVIEALRPILAAHHLYFIQRCEPSEDGVIVHTVGRHISGSEIDFGKLYVPANKRDAQGFGSALTYARRYALVTAFGVPTEDDDGNAASRAASDRPTTGETAPRKTHLNGPYDTVPKLEKAAKEFVRTLNGMSTLAEFDELRDDKEVQEFVAQCKRDLPGWWFANHRDNPPDFIPLEVLAANTRRGLAALQGENA